MNQHDSDVTEQTLSRLAADYAKMGLAPASARDRELAPRVDRDVIRRYIEKGLPPDQTKLVAQLIQNFRGWRQVYTDLLTAPHRPSATGQSEPDPDGEPSA